MFGKNVGLVLLGSLGTAAWLVTSASHAQIVDVSPGGVHVRAPFVSVDVFRGGGVHVRAPFAAVDVGGRPYYNGPPPYVVERATPRAPLPTAQELAAMDDDALRQSLRLAAERLHYRLNRFNTGYTWQRYLRIPDEVLAETSSGDEQYQLAMANWLQRFRNVSDDPQYRKIAELPEFVALQALLIEATSRPVGSSSAAGGRVEDLPPPTPPQGRSTNERSLIDEPVK
jgi:hypothetical protein